MKITPQILNDLFSARVPKQYPFTVPAGVMRVTPFGEVLGVTAEPRKSGIFLEAVRKMRHSRISVDLILTGCRLLDDGTLRKKYEDYLASSRENGFFKKLPWMYTTSGTFIHLEVVRGAEGEWLNIIMELVENPKFLICHRGNHQKVEQD